MPSPLLGEGSGITGLTQDTEFKMPADHPCAGAIKLLEQRSRSWEEVKVTSVYLRSTDAVEMHGIC